MSTKLVAAALAALTPFAAIADCSPDWISATVSDIMLLNQGAIELALTIKNTGDDAIGGAIVIYTVTAEGRPSPLAEAPSQMAHTLPGALLPGEATTLRDVIALSDHAMNIITGLEDPATVTI